MWQRYKCFKSCISPFAACRIVHTRREISMVAVVIRVGHFISECLSRIQREPSSLDPFYLHLLCFFKPDWPAYISREKVNILPVGIWWGESCRCASQVPAFIWVHGSVA